MRRTTGLEERVAWNAGPPRVRLEHAVLDVAAREADELAAIAVLAEVCHSRRTTAPRVRQAWAHRRRLPRRDWLGDVLTDLAEGTCSVLEHGYLSRVERAHGLPGGHRQSARVTERGREYRDVTCPEHRLGVELDGRLFHDDPRARDVDLERDLDEVALHGGLTVRPGWGQVFGRPCRTAQRLAAVLRTRGWRGTPTRCGPTCTVSA